MYLMQACKRASTPGYQSILTLSDCPKHVPSVFVQCWMRRSKLGWARECQGESWAQRLW